METTNIWIEESTPEAESSCPCCSRPVYEGKGILGCDEGELAIYGYRWSEGHESRFSLGVVGVELTGEIKPGMAVVSCRSDGESLIYEVLGPESAPWSSTDSLGPILTRQDVLEHNVIPNLFLFVDAITANDSRLYKRILRETE